MSSQSTLCKLVTVSITLHEDSAWRWGEGGLSIAGLKIDEVGENGIAFLTGSLMKLWNPCLDDWTLSTTPGAIFEIRNLPRVAAEKLVGRRSGQTPFKKVEIKTPTTWPDEKLSELEFKRLVMEGPK